MARNVTFEGEKHWHWLPNEPYDRLYSDWESNPDQRFRKPPFYPLNYQSPSIKEQGNLLLGCKVNDN